MKINIIDYAISHSRVILGILVFILIAGSTSYINIPKEATPDVNIPFIYISLSQKGISPDDSERLLVKPIEDEVKTVEGVKEVRSTAYNGGGNVLLEFDADNISFICLSIFSVLSLADKILNLSTKFLNSLTLPGQP